MECLLPGNDANDPALLAAGDPKVAEAKREEASRSLDRLLIAVPLLGRDELIQRACHHYNGLLEDWASEQGRVAPDTSRPELDPMFLERIAVGYLRHVLLVYERELETVAGMVGAGMVHWGFRRKLLGAIASAYPWLAHECQRQCGEPFSPVLGTS